MLQFQEIVKRSLCVLKQSFSFDQWSKRVFFISSSFNSDIDVGHFRVKKFEFDHYNMSNFQVCSDRF